MRQPAPKNRRVNARRPRRLTDEERYEDWMHAGALAAEESK